MTITNGYGTLAEFKARYIPGTPATDTARDASIELIIQGVSRLIDEHTHRIFYTSTAHTVKYYTPKSWDFVLTDDIISIDTGGLTMDLDNDGTYETVWATTDFLLMPPNSPPYSWIEIAPGGQYTFPLTTNGIKVTGSFGYSAVPDTIREATYLQSYRLWVRHSAPFGVAGGGEMGQATAIAALDPDVMLLIAAYVRRL